MKETKNCVYITPCGWCSKWEKECDKKINKPIESVDTATVEKCESESDHEWECIEFSTDRITYTCKKCGARKITPYESQPLPILYSSIKDNNIPNCCKLCSNHPSNGGSGFCNCTLPYFEQSLTCTATSNTTKLD